MYTADHILLVLTIKYSIKKDGNPTKPFKLDTSVSNLNVLFFPRVVQKSTAHVGKKELNIRHQVQKGFYGIFAGIPQHQKGYLVYVPHKHKILYLYNIIFEESLSSALAYM